jgi:hypothetical protein
MVCVTKNDETRATFCARVVRAPTTRKSKMKTTATKESSRLAWIRKNKKRLEDRARQLRKAAGGQFYWEK